MSEPQNPVKLTEVPTEAQAILIRDKLAECGIRAIYDGAAVAGFRAEAPAMVRVLVAEEHFERAKDLVSEHGLDGGDVDWSQVDVGEAEE